MKIGEEVWKVKVNTINLHVTKSHHADGLPDTQAHTRRHATVKTLHTAGVVDVLEGLANSQVLRAVGIILLALHLNPNHLNRLVPRGKTTTQTGCQDLLPRSKLLTVVLASDFADGRLRQTGETEAGTPVGGLTNSNSVDTTVDTADAFPTVDIREGLEGAGRLRAFSSHLVLGDFNRLHAGTETHRSVRLSDTTGHTSGDTSEEVGSAKNLGTVFRLGRDEEEDSALGGSLNPGPRNETLIICRVGFHM